MGLELYLRDRKVYRQIVVNLLYRLMHSDNVYAMWLH